MGSALAHIELVLLCMLTLSVALIPGLPVPRRWATAGLALIAIQTAAVRTMRIEPFEPALGTRRWEVLDSTAEVVALIVVPALTAALLTVVFWYLARANARTRARLRARMADRGEGGARAHGDPARQA